MKSALTAFLLAGVATCAPHAERPRHLESTRLAPSGPCPFKPPSYHPHHHNGTMPFGASATAGGHGVVTPGSPYPTPKSTPSQSTPSQSTLSQSTLSQSTLSQSTPSQSASLSLNTSPTSSLSSATKSSTGPSQTGKVANAGVNIAGCDFGCDTSGNCNQVQCPSTVGPTQMQHFASDDGLNIFRLPVGWQYLVNNQLGGPLDPNFFATYDAIVQSCLKTGARCIVDIHNYARWNGQIVGQSSVTNDNLANLWTQLAQKYANSTNVVFGVMNEPHDLDMNLWAGTVQAVVTAIRNAGATSQWILLPGTSYTSAAAFATNSAPALEGVKNPDGSTTNLIYDVHSYYDSDSSGTNTECVTDHVSDAFQPLGDYLRQNKRQAFLSETGGGNTASCEQYVCSALTFLNSYSDVYLGWTGWAAGSFDPSSYALSEVPNGNQDTALVSQCIAGKFK